MGWKRVRARRSATPNARECAVSVARMAVISLSTWKALSLMALLIACIAMIPPPVAGTHHDPLGAIPSVAITVDSPRVVVLKSARILHLFDGERLLRSYSIDLGRSPNGQKRRKDDARTPVGSFKVSSKNGQSVYHRFIGIDYPGTTAADWGLARGLISRGQHQSIVRAVSQGLPPDGSTALGGGIGIHGRKQGRDWTGGCVALSDAHVEELYSVLRIGDPIEILP